MLGVAFFPLQVPSTGINLKEKRKKKSHNLVFSNTVTSFIFCPQLAPVGFIVHCALHLSISAIWNF